MHKDRGSPNRTKSEKWPAQSIGSGVVSGMVKHERHQIGPVHFGGITLSAGVIFTGNWLKPKVPLNS